ncbi:NAD(P)-binding protein [Acrocarpospora catenulata]|uniref:NAD(P)-binding protein n=1 Tax=Acrocarpospora catenulata TaxID=2836182 RepID=UPI001BD97C02|nr:NAD(P)-binding protein [Acrocarpospora catenulata]
MDGITVIGGGLAGLTAAIACAEGGARVTLFEAHRTLGGRARSSEQPYVANDGTRVFYSDGEPFRWLARRGLVQPYRKLGLKEGRKARVRYGGTLKAAIPRPLIKAIANRRLVAPVDEDFASWATRRLGADAAHVVGKVLGVVTYDHDPGRLSAAFVWERFRRVTKPRFPAPRYIVGGWSKVVERLATHARDLGIHIEAGTRVTDLPTGPTIVATSLDAARQLLADDSLRWESGRAVLLDLAVRQAPGDLFVISDLDEGGFLERYSSPDPTLAPPGESLIQLQMPVRPGESKADTLTRLELLADLGLPGWRDRLTWRRDATATGRTGALDRPGQTWRDRPAIVRGDGLWLAGDQVAAPGLLSEVSMNSALVAARHALTALPTLRVR